MRVVEPGYPIERIVTSVGGAAPAYFSLRSTTIFRRENGEWKAVHRHADPPPESGAAQEQIRRLVGEGTN